MHTGIDLTAFSESLDERDQRIQLELLWFIAHAREALGPYAGSICNFAT